MKGKVRTILVTSVLLWTIFNGMAAADVKGDSGNGWQMVHNDPQGTSSTPVGPGAKHDLLWGREILFEFEDALVVDNEVYARDFISNVYSLNLSTGETRWRYDPPLFYHMDPYYDYIVGDECIYLPYNQSSFTSNHTMVLVALHRTDGSECFKITFKLNEWIGVPVLNDKGLIIANNTTIRIYDKHTGALLETQPLGTRVLVLYQASDGDLVFFQDKDHMVHAYDITKKATIWTTALEPRHGWFYPLIVVNDKVLMTTTWRKVVALDKANGNQLWSNDDVDALEISANDKYVVATTYWDIKALDITTGALQWSNDLHVTNYSMMSPATIANDEVLVTISDKTDKGNGTAGYTNLTAFDIQTGKELWSYKTSDRAMPFEPPVVVPNEILFINIKGLYALGDRSKIGPLHQCLVQDATVYHDGNVSTTTDKNVKFAAPAVNGIDQGSATYQWNFGDGTNTTVKDPVHAFKRSGTYAVTLTVKQSERKIVIQNDVNARPVTQLRAPFPFYNVVITIVLISVVIGLVGLSRTEPGMYWMLPFFFLLYSRIKKVEALDHYTRGRIMGYLQANPGEHYNSIREELGIQNGVLAYHLKVLEREGYIRSRRDRILKRFYPSGTKVPEPISVEEQIIGAIRRNPGITQIEIAEKTGLAPSTIHRVLHQQEQAGAVVLVRDGRLVRCHLLKEPAQ
jgi:outer membrane protein assembly factor BamB/predicted transcriptional regulator